MSDRTDFGVLYGQRTTSNADELLIYSSYEDAKASPKQGDFIVLTQKDESGQKYLARVEAEIYDEDPIFRSQDKTLVAVHYARIAERELSDRDKQKMFSYTYRVRMLGMFTDSGQSITFTTAVRKLPVVSYHARHLNQREVNAIINSQDEGGAALGYLCIGEDIQNTKGPIQFKVDKLRSSRTMVFAQSGYGKTNFVKVLLYHVIKDTSYGKLIFDLNGEYVFNSGNTTGLAETGDREIGQNLVVFTDKPVKPETIQGRFVYGGKVRINTHQDMSVSDILNFGAGFSEVMRSFLLYLDSEQVGNFIAKINSYAQDPSQLHHDFPDFWGKSDGKGDVSARKTINAIRKRISHLIEEGKGIHSQSSKMIELIWNALREGKTVIVDLSLKDSLDANVITTILVRLLFENNKEVYTSEEPNASPIETVIFIEEAQNVLAEEFVKTNSNPFVRCAKEGRKFGIGLVAITQRPSAISDEIRTQAENFFALHMGNSDDIRALVKSSIHYDGVIAGFLQRESIKGNVYMVTSGKAFAIPIRVSLFEDLISNNHKSRR